MKTIFTALAICLGAFSTVSTAQEASPASETVMTVSQGEFTKKRYTVHGAWEIVSIDGKQVIKFSEGFKTKNGPDLKVFLSPSTLGDLGKKTDVSNSVNIGVLKSNKGKQVYTLPDGVNLSDYQSVLIHCEAYSVLWGGFDIPQ